MTRTGGGRQVASLRRDQPLRHISTSQLGKWAQVRRNMIFVSILSWCYCVMVKVKITGVISSFKCDHCDHNINFISTLSERSGSRLEVSRSEEQVVIFFRDFCCWKLKHHQVEQRDAGTEMAPRLEGSSGGAEDPRTGLGSDPKARILLSGDIESNPGPPRRFEIWFEV